MGKQSWLNTSNPTKFIDAIQEISIFRLCQSYCIDISIMFSRAFLRPARSTLTNQGWRQYSGHNICATPESAVLLNLKNEVKVAMRAKDKMKLAVVKDILAQVLNASKTKSPVESDGQVYNLLRSSIAKRLDSAKSYRQHDRVDLAETEEAEVQILQSYVPKEMEERDIQAVVLDVVNSIAATQKDMGKVLKELATRLDESVAPKAVQARIVKQILASGSGKNQSQSG